MLSNIFNRNYSLNCRGTLVNLSSPIVMGILNITSDSFFEGSRVTEKDAICRLADKHLKAGAVILDVGAMSTRPGAKEIAVERESERIANTITLLQSRFPEAILSVDTYRSTVVKTALEAGAHMINDVGATEFDPSILKVIAGFDHVPYILMHNRSKSVDMHKHTNYTNILADISTFFHNKIYELKQFGLEDIVIDPGIGFSKNIDQNFEILSGLSSFRLIGKPILVGLSRKSFIHRSLDITPETSLNGTTAMHMIALMQGAQILRVHDVREANECIQLFLRLPDQNLMG